MQIKFNARDSVTGVNYQTGSTNGDLSVGNVGYT